MLEGDRQESQLNLSSSERFRAALAGLLSISLVTGIVYPPALGLSLALLVTAFLANRGLYLLILRRNGIRHSNLFPGSTATGSGSRVLSSSSR